MLICVLPFQYQRDSEPRAPSCQEHRRQPLNMYCVQDRQLICGLCLTVGQHHGHPIDDLQAAFVREKQTPALLLARLSEQKWSQVGAGRLSGPLGVCGGERLNRNAVPPCFRCVSWGSSWSRRRRAATLC